MRNQLSERRRKEIASLIQRKYRERLEQMLVEGVRSVAAAVLAGAPLVDVVVAEERQGDEAVQALLKQVGVPVYVLPERDVARISDVETSQGIIATVATRLIPEKDLPEKRTLLVLDGVQDPGNVGTIIRTAAWFGVGAVVAGPGSVDLFNPKVVRAAMGGLWDVGLARTGDLKHLLRRLREAGFTCYGADPEGTDLTAWKPQAPSALVLGSEAHGLSPDAAANLDARIAIPGTPQRRGTESLNVAVAAGILLYQWSHSR